MTYQGSYVYRSAAKVQRNCKFQITYGTNIQFQGSENRAVQKELSSKNNLRFSKLYQ